MKNQFYKSSSSLAIGILSFFYLYLILSAAHGQQWSAITNNNIYNLNTGNVGVGSTAPTYKLEVVSTNNAKLLVKSSLSPNAALIEVNAPSGTGVFESISTPSSMIRIGSRLNQDFSLFSFNTDRLIIKGDGKIGIGKSNPAHPLDVNGIINATGLYLNNQPIVQSQWSTSGSTINFNSGLVCIGTLLTPVGYKLAVGGKVISEEVVIKLQANWPDYVFSKTYKLPSLADLARFIREQKHLPDVPTAQSIRHQGLPVGEMNVILLKKIEELTLYILQQEERLVALENNQVKK